MKNTPLEQAIIDISGPAKGAKVIAWIWDREYELNRRSGYNKFRAVFEADALLGRNNATPESLSAAPLYRHLAQSCVRDYDDSIHKRNDITL